MSNLVHIRVLEYIYLLNWQLPKKKSPKHRMQVLHVSPEYQTMRVLWRMLRIRH